MLPNEDPGWKPALGFAFWMLISAGQSTKRFDRSAGQPGHSLSKLRGLTLMFVFAMVAIGFCVYLLVTTDAFPAPWKFNAGVLAMAAVCAACLVASEMVGRRLALDCSSDEALLASFNTRLFLRIAIVESAALLGFYLFIVGYPVLFVVGLGTTMFGLWRIAPTTARIELEDDRLRSAGCSRSFTSALRASDEEARAPKAAATTTARPKSPAQSPRTNAGEGGSSRVHPGRTTATGTDGPAPRSFRRAAKKIMVAGVVWFVLAHISDWIQTPDPNPNEEVCVSLAAELLNFHEQAQPDADYSTGYDTNAVKDNTQAVLDGFDFPDFCSALIFDAAAGAGIPRGAVETSMDDMPEFLLADDYNPDLHRFYRIDDGETTILMRVTNDGSALQYAAAYGTDCDAAHRTHPELYSWVVVCYEKPLAG